MTNRYSVLFALFVPSAFPSWAWVPPSGIRVGGRRDRLSSPTLIISSSSSQQLTEPDESSSFGRREFWDEAYRTGDLNEAKDEGTFSWYCDSWEDLEPFFAELVSDRGANILIPGVGNDAAIRGMFDAGYKRLSAFDYAPEGVECARKMFGDDRLKKIDLRVADARDLVEYSDNSFDAVLEKGTLDSVYLSGGKDKEKALGCTYPWLFRKWREFSNQEESSSALRLLVLMLSVPPLKLTRAQLGGNCEMENYTLRRMDMLVRILTLQCSPGREYKGRISVAFGSQSNRKRL